MKSGSAALTAAVKKRVWRPAISVKVDDRRNCGVSPLVWSQWYDGSEVNVGHTAMAACGDTVSDFRVSSAASELYGRQTELDETPEPLWSKRATNVRTDAQIAACSNENNVWVFWVDADQRTIKYRLSSNGGLTYVAEATAVTLDAGHKCNSLAAVAPGNGLHDVILLLVDTPTEDSTTQDKVIKWAYFIGGSGWTGPSAWDRDPGKYCTGIAAADFDCDATHTELVFLVSGKFEELSSGYNVQSYHLNVDNAHTPTWTHGGEVWQGSSSKCQPAYVSMVSEGEYDRARALVQYYDGSLPAAKRWQVYHFYIHELLTADDLVFGPWSPFEITNHAYTLGICRVGDVLVAGANNSLWKASTWDGSDPWLVDVTDDLVSFEHHVFDNALIEDVQVQPGYGYVFLQNFDGRYQNVGESEETYEAIKRGAQVVIKCGYKTSDGDEMEVLPPMWIDRIIQVCNPRSSTSQNIPHVSIPSGPLLGGRYVVLSMYDVWALTTRRGPTNDYSSSKAPRDIFRSVFGSMGLKYSDDGTERLGLGGGGYPQVRWQTLQGNPWYLMLRDMLRYVHCRVKFYTDYNDAEGWPTARAHVFADRDVDPADLEVGGEDQPVVLAALYTEQDRFGGYLWEWSAPPYSLSSSSGWMSGASGMSGPWTGAVLEGDGASELEIDYERVAAVGYWQPRPVVDFQVSENTYITPADRVGFAADESQPLYGGQVLIPLHPCLEIWDRFHVSDARACQALQKRFVVGIETFYDTRGERGRYDQVVHLMRHVK